MHKDFLNEFCRIYKRLMTLEHTIKDRMFQSFSGRYKNDAYNKIYPYFVTIDTLHKNSTFLSVFNNKNLSNNEKLKESFYLMYISDLLKIIENNNHKNNLIKGGFFSNYNKSLDSNFLRSKSSHLVQLRNSIAHFNYKQYNKNKKKYLDALNFFEIQMNINQSFQNITLPSNQLSTKNILNAIYKADKTLFKNDRHLINIFEDIALSNGLSLNKLPTYWTIIRQKYNLERIEREKTN